MNRRFRFVASDGCALSGRIAGRPDAPAVLLAHPVGFDSRFWDAVVDRLSEHRMLIVPDARGHGASGRGEGENSVDQMADDVISALDYLGADRVGLVGCSMGSMLGMFLGARYPERFDWLVLANGPARIQLPRARLDQTIAAAREGELPVMARDMLSRWLAPGTEAERPDFFARLLEHMGETDGDGFADAFTALRDSDRNDDLGRIAVKTCVVTGASDPAFSPDAAAAMAAAIPGADVAVLAGAGHLSPVEQPDAFAALVLGMEGRLVPAMT